MKYLDENIKEEELEAEFEKYGELVSVKIDKTSIKDKEGGEKEVSKGVAFVS